MVTRGREVLWTVVMIIELKPEDELLVNNPLQSGPPSGIEECPHRIVHMSES
jgi:hypothetical protein